MYSFPSMAYRHRRRYTDARPEGSRAALAGRGSSSIQFPPASSSVKTSPPASESTPDHVGDGSPFPLIFPVRIVARSAPRTARHPSLENTAPAVKASGLYGFAAVLTMSHCSRRGPPTKKAVSGQNVGDIQFVAPASAQGDTAAVRRGTPLPVGVGRPSLHLLLLQVNFGVIARGQQICRCCGRSRRRNRLRGLHPAVFAVRSTNTVTCGRP